MRCIVIAESGGPEQLQFAQVPVPELTTGMLLVGVRAIGVNRADILQRRGLYPPPSGASDVPGLEVAGEVLARDGNCSRFVVGDRVCALLSGGGYAEQVGVAESSVIPVPPSMGLEQAAAIPEAFLTAFDALYGGAKLQAGETVLVHAAASGVGTAALQLVRIAGARALAVVGNEDKAQRCSELGASACCLRHQQDLDEFVQRETGGQGVDVVLDFVGGAQFARNIEWLAMDGRLILLGLMAGRDPGRLDLARLLGRRIRVDARTLRNRSDSFKAELVRSFEAQCMEAFADGRLQPVVDRIWDWSQVAEAHRYMEENRNTGKLVLRTGDYR